MSYFEQKPRDKNANRRVKPWSLFFLTSCLTTTADQITDLSKTDSTALTHRSDAQLLTADSHAALSRSIESVVEEFFSFKNLLIAPAYAEVVRPKGGENSTAPGTPQKPGGDKEQGEPAGNPDVDFGGDPFVSIGDGDGGLSPGISPAASPDASPNPSPAPAPSPAVSEDSSFSSSFPAPCPSFEGSSSVGELSPTTGPTWPTLKKLPAQHPDHRYRDLCVSGATLDPSDFNTKTGVAMAVDIDAISPNPSPSPDSPATLFHEKIAGTVSGAKPPMAAGDAYCMPLRDTPKIATNFASFSDVTKANKAFSHYLNMDNDSFVIPTTGLSKFDVYKNSNDYRRKTFFIGGPDAKLNCPDLLALGKPESTATVAELAAFQRAKAENCYNYYILNHSAAPWFTLERPGESTDDPLTHFNPNRAILDSCQPLLNGTSAKLVAEKKWAESVNPPASGDVTADDYEENSGFSTVWQYDTEPALDEAEYLLSDYLQEAWEENFETLHPSNTEIPTKLKKYIHKNFTDISLPCVQKIDGSAPPSSSNFPPPLTSTSSESVDETLTDSSVESIPSSCPSGPVSPSPDPGPECKPPTRKITHKTYTSKGTGPVYYCPNIEKIVEPSHIFSPRHDMVVNDLKTKPDSVGLTYSAVDLELFDQPVEDKNDNGMTNEGAGEEGYLTDRDYSWKTSICEPKCTSSEEPKARGYTTYNPRTCPPAKPDCIRTSHYFRLLGIIDGTDLPLFSNTQCGECEDKDGKGQTDNCWIWRDQQVRDPIVQCAMVPVDILEFRREQFDNCIMQRINYNFNEWHLEWIENGIPPDWSVKDAPCKTRFYETDNPGKCKVKMSIQQCCHILIKDVVPANNLKFKTCENLIQNRLDTDPLDILVQLVHPMWNLPDIPDVSHITDEWGFNSKCPPWFPDCYPMDSSVTTGSGSPATHKPGTIDGIGMEKGTYNKARRMTEALNMLSKEPTKTCGFPGPDSQLHPTEPDEYRFGHYFKKFIFPELRVETPPEEYPHDQDPYFVGYHMPYMKRLDTGASSGNPYHAGSFTNTLGGFDVWVGVGREERSVRDGEIASAAVKPPEATDTGGSVKDRLLAYDQPSQIGRIGGWAEAKAHQMWSTRRSNLSCIGRYEKLFKPGGPEQLALSKAGSGYTSKEYKQWPWPLGWRGYVTDSHDADWNFAFPHFPEGEGTPAAAKITVSNGYRGLDNALPGDIIIYTMNSVKYIAYVTDIGFDVANRKNAKFNRDISKYELNGEVITPNRVFVVSWDQGKFPTAAGSTLNWGLGPQREIYKYKVPGKYSEEICSHKIRALVDAFDPETGTTPNLCKTDGPRMSEADCKENTCQPSCEDPDFNKCVLPGTKADWESAVIYRPYKDVRKCINYGALGYPKDAITDLDATYDWTGNLDASGNAPPPNPSVVYQGLSHRVNTNVWSYCANAGWDPPASWNREYSGAQTGATTDVTLCGPKWHGKNAADPSGCAVESDAKTELFPKKAITPPVFTPPSGGTNNPSAPGGSGGGSGGVTKPPVTPR